MVKLRLKRMGSKFNAFYRIIVADAKAPRDGRFIEEIGYYNPHTKEAFVNNELKTKWESKGAKPSETVKKLFKKIEITKAKGNVKNGVVTWKTEQKKSKKATKKIIEQIGAKKDKTIEQKTNELKETSEDKEVQKNKERK